jgi:hypothetical protein
MGAVEVKVEDAMREEDGAFTRGRRVACLLPTMTRPLLEVFGLHPRDGWHRWSLFFLRNDEKTSAMHSPM